MKLTDLKRSLIDHTMGLSVMSQASEVHRWASLLIWSNHNQETFICVASPAKEKAVFISRSSLERIGSMRILQY